MSICWPFRAKRAALPRREEDASDGWDDESELPIDIYGPASDELWREILRRRHLVVATETLAELALNEGYPTSAKILRDAAARLAGALVRSRERFSDQSACLPTAAEMALRALAARQRK